MRRTAPSVQRQQVGALFPVNHCDHVIRTVQPSSPQRNCLAAKDHVPLSRSTSATVISTHQRFHAVARPHCLHGSRRSHEEGESLYDTWSTLVSMIVGQSGYYLETRPPQPNFACRRWCYAQGYVVLNYQMPSPVVVSFPRNPNVMGDTHMHG